MAKNTKVKVTRKKNESSERLISKFSKAFQSARVGIQVHEKRYRRKKLTKNKSRIKAVMREHYRAIRQKEQFK